MNEAIRKIYRSLLLRIKDEQLLPGDLLPKGIELAQQFNTNRMNAHRALKELEKNDIVSSKKRVGTKVNPDLDHEMVLKLLHESNRFIYVLYSMTPHWIHWNEASFAGLEEIVEQEGFSVNYCNIPTGNTRKQYKSLLKKIFDAGTSALVIFPDIEDTWFMADNVDLFLDFPMPIFMLNRGGEPMATDMVSFVSMDPFGDGVMVGNLLKKNHCDYVLMLNEATGEAFWGIKRFEGLKMALTRKGHSQKLVLRNIAGTAEGVSEIAGIIAASSRKVTVVAVNNEFAARFIDFCKASKLSPGSDYNLIAFDDNPLYRSYNITSMGTSMHEIGQIFGRLICDSSWINTYKGKISIKVPSVLTIRQSFVPKNYKTYPKRIR